MRLYLLRHATALDYAPTDAVRPLAPPGETEAAKVGQILRQGGANITRIFHSPYLRTQQTAAIISRELAFTGTIKAIPDLLNGTSTMALLRTIWTLKPTGDTLLIGHMPSLTDHLNTLLGTDHHGAFSTAGCACLDMTGRTAGTGKLVWFKTYAELVAGL